MPHDEPATDLRVAFDRVATWLDAQGVWVDLCGPAENDMRGSFRPRTDEPGMRPHVELFRTVGEVVPDAADEELALLAHEAGHWRSWKLRERPGEPYEHAINVEPDEWPALPAETRKMVLDEETRAWRHGRELLAEVVPELPASFWSYYDSQAIASLDTYRRKLDLVNG